MDNLDALIDEESQILRELQELSPFDEDGIPKEVLFGDTGFIPINTSPPVCKCLACRDDPEFNMSPPDPSDIYMGHNPHYCKYFPLEEEIIDQAPVLMDTNAGKSSNNKSEEAGREEIEININDLLNRSPESHPSKYITPEERKSFTYRPIIFEPHPMRKFVKDGSPIPSPITSNKSDTSGMSTPEGPFILIHPPRLNSLIKASESSSFQEQPVQTEASYRKSTLIVAIRRFAKATKIPNEDIVGAIDNLHLRFKDHKHSELFPPSDSRSTNDSFSGDAAFQVKVPLIPFNMGDPSETMHSFCILKIQNITDPSTGKVYVRYIYSLGVDKDLEDDSTFTHPMYSEPNYIHIIKSHETKFANSKYFEDPYRLIRSQTYNTDNTSSPAGHKRRLSF